MYETFQRLLIRLLSLEYVCMLKPKIDRETPKSNLDWGNDCESKRMDSDRN